MKILVTGASSFIGKYLTRKLNQLGHVVVGTYYKNRLEIPGIKLVSLDLNNCESMELLFEENEFDVVFHLASYMPKKRREAPEIEALKCVNVNAIGTYRLLNYCHENKIKKFVYPSTAMVYDRYTTPLPAKEEHASPCSLHSASKYVGEAFCECFRKERGLDTVSLRLSSVYGFGQEAYCVLPLFVEKVIRNENIEVWGKGVRTQDFIYVEDVVNALIEAAFTEAVGIFNVGSGEETSMASLAMIIKYVFNHNVKIINKSVEKEDTSRFFLDVTKARREWGYEARPLISGLRVYRRRWEESLENRTDL